MRSINKHTLYVILAFAAIYIIWGTTYLAIAIAVETLPPFFMAGSRFFFAGTLFLIALRLRGVPPPSRAQWRSAAIVGGLLLVGGNGLLTWSEQQVPSGTASLIIATVPLWIALFDWLIFHGSRPTRQVTAGLLLGLGGIILLIGPDQLRGTAVFSNVALLILLLAPILWSLGSLLSREVPMPENSFMATAAQQIAGGGLLLLVGLLTGEIAQLDFDAFSTRSLAAMAYLTLFGSFIGFSAYIWLLKNVKPTKVATYSYVNPVIAVFLGWLILSEPITLLTIAAVAAIVVAVILITTARPRPLPVVSPAQVRTRRNPSVPAERP